MALPVTQKNGFPQFRLREKNKYLRIGYFSNVEQNRWLVSWTRNFSNMYCVDLRCAVISLVGFLNLQSRVEWRSSVCVGFPTIFFDTFGGKVPPLDSVYYWHTTDLLLRWLGLCYIYGWSRCPWCVDDYLHCMQHTVDDWWNIHHAKSEWSGKTSPVCILCWCQLFFDSSSFVPEL